MKIKFIPKNHVLLQIECLRHKKKAFASGVEIIIDPMYEPEQNAYTNGIVKAIPESLYYNDKDIMQSTEILTDIIVKPGDQVFFHYLQINEAIANDKVIQEDGKFYIFIRHDSLFCSIRDSEVVMHNGWLLLEPIEKAVDKEKKFLPNIPRNRQQEDPLKGVIAHMGKPVDKYFWNKQESDSGINVEKGDTVIFLPHSDIPLEYPMHQSLDKKYFRIQRKDILSIYK